MDWDWLNWFPTNVNNDPPDQVSWGYWNYDPNETPQPTNTIFAMATKLLDAGKGKFGYAVSEISFLRKFAEMKPDQWAIMKRANPQSFSIIGGGEVSPDNLLPHAEAFIRNYLTGIVWQRSQNLTWNGALWLPDDFGHDSQLPIVLEAMGVTSVSFARVPGSCQQGYDPIPDGFVSAHQILLDPASGGLDFNWAATDGSTMFTHYMPHSYCDGERIDKKSETCEANDPEVMSKCKCNVKAYNSLERIKAWYDYRKVLSPTPYVFIPIGCDFAMPRQKLVDIVDQWNTKVFPTTGVYAVSSQFDKYAFFVKDWLAHNGSRTQLKTRTYHGSSSATVFRPTPYWQGYYSSRPALKYYHFEVTKILMAAETFNMLGRAIGVKNATTQKEIDALWELQGVSTHHDFVTGTATDYVYYGEQLPMMQKLYQDSLKLRDRIIDRLMIALRGHPGVAVFNQNGFPVSNQFAMFDVPTANLEDVLSHFGDAVQHVSTNGRFATVASLLSAPSMGYKFYSADEIASFKSPGFKKAGVSVSASDSTVTLENDYLKATISNASAWSIVSLVDKKAPGGPKNILRGGNVLQWRYDGGNIYRYGYEEGCGFDKYNEVIKTYPPQVIEEGPIRTVVRVSFTMSASSPRPFPTTNYTIEYSLVKSEPFIRINITGAATGVSSIITSFQFRSQITNYTHGTPYHWDWKRPFPYGHQSDFLVTMESVHDFIGVMDSTGNYLGAIYPMSSPSWGVINDTLHGVILRNSPGDNYECHNYGADGSDKDVHSVAFALRVPTGFDLFTARQEARAYNTPLITRTLAAVVPFRRNAAQIGDEPTEFSLATVKSPQHAFITTFKAGSVNPSATIMRVYTPSNLPERMEIATGANVIMPGMRPTIVSALELFMVRNRFSPAVSARGSTLFLNSTRADRKSVV